MKRYTLFRVLLIVLCSLFSSNSITSQESFYKVPMTTQIQESTSIIEGKVISKSSFWDDVHQNIYTSNLVEVYKVLKGQSDNTIEIITKGGIVDLQAEVVSNSLQLKEGDLGVFMLREIKNIAKTNSDSSELKSYQSAHANQGFFKYNFENNLAVNSVTNIEGITTNFYNSIEEHTNQKIVELSSFDVSNHVQLITESNSKARSSNSAVSIISFSASNNSAGTKSVLTINGNNFGSVQGSVGFRDANFGGAIFANALDSQILSWSNTVIEVEIPQHAGTGTVRVYTDSNGTITSANDLIIEYAQTNLEYNLGSGNIAYQTQHIDNNSEGGNIWEMNVDFYNSLAKAPFENAFETWTCQSGINWMISNNTTSNTVIANDDQNLITFNDLSSGLLGQCTSRYSGCLVNGEIRWYVEEMDIVFNSNINWNLTSNSPSSGEIDFESVAVHELGHGQQLGHVIDNDLIMHYSLPGGIAQRQLSPEDLMGAQDIMSRSTTTSICNQPVMTTSSCFNNSLSSDDFVLSEEISMYPNPATDLVIIKSASSVTITNIAIYSMEGKQVYKSPLFESSNKEISVEDIPIGLYFVNITTDSGIVSQKLIVK